MIINEAVKGVKINCKRFSEPFSSSQPDAPRQIDNHFISAQNKTACARGEPARG